MKYWKSKNAKPATSKPSAAFKNLIKKRAQARPESEDGVPSLPEIDSQDTPAPSKVPTTDWIPGVTPSYNPEPALLPAKTPVLTPGSQSEWTQENFPWSTQVATLNTALFHNDGFKACQKEVINAVMAKRQVFVCMPTGAGKSLLYQIPAVASRGLTLVVMPLISLIKDQVDFLVEKSIRAKCLIGTQKLDEQRTVLQALESDDSIQILITTPERLASGFAMQNILRNLHSSGKLERLVIDEAHCISKWGTDFRADYLKLADIMTMCPGLPVLCMTSTAPERVREDIIEILGLKNPLCFVTSLNRPNLMYEVRPKTDTVKSAIAKLISDRFPGQSGIVYCLAKSECDDLAKTLSRQYRIPAAAYHAAHSPEERTNVQEAWLRGEIKVVAATIAFGLGINKKDVRFVIHSTLPKSLDDYYQESGRAGRDGDPASCVLYYSYKDKARLDYLLQNMATKPLHAAYADLSKMLSYCEDKVSCRRQTLLAHFGEHTEADGCQRMCDNCRTGQAHEEIDVTDMAVKILDCLQTQCKFTTTQLICLLRGERSRDTDKSHPRFGCLKKTNQDAIRRVIIEMCARGVLQEVPGAACAKACYTSLCPGPNVQLLTQGKQPFYITRPSNVTVKEEEGETAPESVEASPSFSNRIRALRELRERMALERNVEMESILTDGALLFLGGRPQVSDDRLIDSWEVDPGFLQELHQMDAEKLSLRRPQEDSGKRKETKFS